MRIRGLVGDGNPETITVILWLREDKSGFEDWGKWQGIEKTMIKTLSIFNCGLAPIDLKVRPPLHTDAVQ